jgi:hypothetical protein
MKNALRLIEISAQEGRAVRESPFLDTEEKLDTMCEYFEVILDCLEGRISAAALATLGEIDGQTEDNEESWDSGYGCGCGGNCVCGQAS